MESALSLAAGSDDGERVARWGGWHALRTAAGRRDRHAQRLVRGEYPVYLVRCYLYSSRTLRPRPERFAVVVNGVSLVQRSIALAVLLASQLVAAQEPGLPERPLPATPSARERNIQTG